MKRGFCNLIPHTKPYIRHSKLSHFFLLKPNANIFDSQGKTT